MSGFPTPGLSKPFDPAPQRERMRGVIALALVGVVLVEVLFALVVVASGRPFEPVREVLVLTFGATTTLLGSALGFYFGQQGAGRGG